MSQLLTTRQAEELHKSMIAYFLSVGMNDSAAALRRESNLPDTFDDATAKKYETLLEKKWTSVVRLQKKIMDLEAKNATLQHEIETATPLSSHRKIDPVTWLPRNPARHTLQGHRLPVTSVAFHPIFSSLASASEDSTIKIWDWELGELERTLKGHTKSVLDVDFGGPRGATLLASCSSDLTIRLWDPSDEYKNIRTLPGHDHSISCIRFIPSGAAGAPLSGNTLVSASRDKTLRIWDVTTGYCLKTLKGHTDWVRTVTPSIDGRFLLSAGNDQIPRLWDASSGEVKITFLGHEHVVECVAFAPGSSYVHLSSIAGYKKPPPASSCGEFLATGGRDKIIKIWDNRGTCHKTLVGHDNWVRGLVFHPGGRYLLSISDDKTIRCWDLSQECKCIKVVDEAHQHFISSIRWAPDVPVQPVTNGESNGVSTASKKEDSGVGGKIRCVIATASVDLNVRVFAG
ncbi:nuclear distribution protein PAC1 [Exophiala xenobiotica]|uniref:Nuclear distribution protein PAC1 n=1 Tax=Exophiala xenobiotica TaxID=348802 RepID=A0A0D2END6_9EURO|nr:nuclear distribution protein PAC1 [Exophiala xenobiotica]KIW49364.1 nuclear distribution protein PAC1 [Exophiala xenobiotica]